MGRATVLLIGRVGVRDDFPVETLEKRYHLISVASGKQALTEIKLHAVQVVILNAASMRTPGDRVCKILRQEFPALPIIHVHSGSDVNSPADLVFVAPISSRRLIYGVERLLKAKGDEIIQCGPFSMNVPRRVLMAHGQETQLTPKLSGLVELFLRHPNEIIDRKRLMETIWDTDYMGDTRTLDVHIRWVRKALECDGEHPRRLNTVRGIGYRLDVPEVLKVS